MICINSFELGFQPSFYQVCRTNCFVPIVIEGCRKGKVRVVSLKFFSKNKKRN